MTDRLSGSLLALEAKSGIAGAYQLSSPDKTQSRCGRRKWKTLSQSTAILRVRKAGMDPGRNEYRYFFSFQT